MKMILKDRAGNTIERGSKLVKDGKSYQVAFTQEPHRQGTSGKIGVLPLDIDLERDSPMVYYITVFDLHWVEEIESQQPDQEPSDTGKENNDGPPDQNGDL